MNPLDRLAADWPALSALLDEALSLSADARGPWLERLSGTQAALGAELQRLLAVHASAESADFMGTLPRPAGTPGGDAASGHAGPAAGDLVGPWRLLDELGRGGMGTVWLAERTDGQLKRQVALKLPHLAWDRGLAGRMARERDILATLSHPNIARLYDAGFETDGRPWLALEYVVGRQVDVFVQANALGLRARLDLLLQVCAAVAFAHSRLVIHRDLKPSNILVTDDGQVRLLDFGISKLLTGEHAAETHLTRAAGRPMTLDYASPEQVAGEPLGTPSDVYSLAVVAYEVLTGRKPYRLVRGSAAELEEAIAGADAVAASANASDPALRAALRGDLDAILNKALKKSVAERYPTVDALALDLRRHLDSKAVLARPDSLRYRSGKWLRRNRVQAWAGGLSALALVGGATVALVQAQQARQQAARAEQVKAFVLSIFGDAGTQGGGTRFTTAVDLLERAQGRIERELADDPLVRVELMSAVGTSMQSLGEAKLAEPLLAAAVAQADERLGAGHSQAHMARVAHAQALLALGRLDDTERVLRPAFAALQGRPSISPEALVTAWQVNAFVQSRRGSYDAAASAMRSSLAVARQHLPNRPEVLLAAHIELVNAMTDIGDAGREAEVARMQTFARVSFGNAVTPLTLRARFFAIYSEELRFEHIAQLETLLAGMRGVYGQRHPDLSMVLQHLATTRDAYGDAARSLPEWREARDIDDALQGDTASFDRAFVRLRLGYSFLLGRQPRQAVQQLTPALTMLESALVGGEIGVIITARALLALAQAEAGLLAEAEQTLGPAASDLVAGVKGAAGPQDWNRAARVRKLQGRTVEAEALILRAIAGFEALGRNGDVRESGSQHALIVLEAGRPAEALPLLKAHYDLLRKVHRVDSPQLAELSTALARAHLAGSAAGDAQAAVDRAAWSHAHWQATDPAHREAGVAAYWLARALAAQGSRHAALAVHREARRVMAADPRPSDAGLPSV